MVLNTDRLFLRFATVEDYPFIYELMNSEGWKKYIGDRGIHGKKEAVNYITESLIKSYINNGFGLYVVCLNDSKELLGLCGLLKRDELEFEDIGFAFLPKHQSKGYAFESAQAVVGFANQQLQLSTLLAITLKENSRSISLLEKLGFHFDKTIVSKKESLQQYKR